MVAASRRATMAAATSRLATMAAAAVTLLRLPLARLSYHLRSIEEESAAEAEAPRSFVLPPNLVSTFSDNLESNKLLKVCPHCPSLIAKSTMHVVFLNTSKNCVLSQL